MNSAIPTTGAGAQHRPPRGSIANLSDLLGACQDGFKWHRALLFFLALFMSESITNIARAVTNGTSIKSILAGLPNAIDLYQSLYLNLFLTLLAAGTLLAIRRAALAVPVIAVFYLTLVRPVSFMAYLTLVSAGSYGVSFRELTADFWNLPAVFSSLLFPILLFGSLAAALHFIRNWRLAVGVGSVSTALLMQALQALRHTAESRQADLLGQVAFGILDYVVFAVVLTACLVWSDGGRTVPERKWRLPKGPFVALLATSHGLSLMIVVSSLGALFSNDKDQIYQIIGFWLLMISASLLSGMATCTLIYRMWAAIQDGHARTSPGRAVGLLFVPLYNLIWIFHIFAGFATDYNRYCERNGRPYRMEGGLPVAVPVLIIATMIPGLGLLATPVLAVAMVALTARICDAVGNLEV